MRRLCAIALALTMLGCSSAEQTGAPSRTGAADGAFRSVAAGGRHSCGLRTNDTITCWGDNSDGQADPPAGTFRAITAGWDYSCGLRTDNTITCWGDSPVAGTPHGGTFRAVTAGGRHSCGLRTDNTIECWGKSFDGQADPPSGTFRAVTAGGDRSCGLRTDNTIECWGRDFSGLATPPGTFRAVTAGSCALRTDDTIECWGSNLYGAADPPGGAFRAITAGGSHLCGFRTVYTILWWVFPSFHGRVGLFVRVTHRQHHRMLGQ
ncbi:MAG: hypothetical protein J4F99_05225 [Acidimicrobiia bacterium]|nr:hypothetical protein [Acidimicrobiia bacterium]